MWRDRYKTAIQYKIPLPKKDMAWQKKTYVSQLVLHLFKRRFAAMPNTSHNDK